MEICHSTVPTAYCKRRGQVVYIHMFRSIIHLMDASDVTSKVLLYIIAYITSCDYFCFFFETNYTSYIKII